MRNKILMTALILLCGILAAETFPVPALPFAPRSYTCFHTFREIRVDGSLDEPDWMEAPWTELFTDIEGEIQPAPHLDTRVKMLWDSQGLYIAARLYDPHIWAKLTQHDSVIFQDNDFEVFIDPDGDTHHYAEIEVNALGTVWDLFLIKPYRDEHSALNGWECPGLEVAIGIEGTLNDPSDTDLEWTVEMLIPWEAMAEFANKPVPPEEGDFWRINFSRVQWQTQILDGQYEKVPGKPEYNWVWSPQGLINMHYPERWGYVFFTRARSGEADPGFIIPQEEQAREYLRQVYYAQRQHWLDRGSYARSLSKLQMKPLDHSGKRLKPILETTSKTFVATLRLDPQTELMITEDGRLTKSEQ
ncbi:MAG: carbohydrate-binding family 9-like protein [Candidatus Syntrophosphaera sp.]|nr:carbohydrate-binding family 9-like protein [Candidatus Syntrophosphaera sp.]